MDQHKRPKKLVSRIKFSPLEGKGVKISLWQAIVNVVCSATMKLLLILVFLLIYNLRFKTIKVLGYRIMGDMKFRRILQRVYRSMSIYNNLSLDLLLNLLDQDLLNLYLNLFGFLFYLRRILGVEKIIKKTYGDFLSSHGKMR